VWANDIQRFARSTNRFWNRAPWSINIICCSNKSLDTAATGPPTLLTLDSSYMLCSPHTQLWLWRRRQSSLLFQDSSCWWWGNINCGRDVISFRSAFKSTCIAIKDLHNYSRADVWLGSQSFDVWMLSSSCESFCKWSSLLIWSSIGRSSVLDE